MPRPLTLKFCMRTDKCMSVCACVSLRRCSAATLLRAALLAAGSSPGPEARRPEQLTSLLGAHLLLCTRFLATCIPINKESQRR